MRKSGIRSSFHYFGNTKVGQELAKSTKEYMNDVNRGNKSNFMTRFLTRRRNIDRMQQEVDDKITLELHPAFQMSMKLWTMMVTTPVLGGLVMGTIAPTRAIVWFNFTTQERYDKVWEFANPFIVLGGQLLMFLVYYDFSVYLRYPVFKFVFAPAFRKMGMYATKPVGIKSLHELRKGGLRSKATVKPLGGGPNKKVQ